MRPDASSGPSTSPLERSVPNRTVVVALAVGVALTVLLKRGLSVLLPPLAAHCVPSDAAPTWCTTSAALLSAIAALAPGFIAGILYPRKAFLVGLLCSLVGGALYLAFYGNVWDSDLSPSNLIFFNSLIAVWLLIASLPQALFGAAAGGCAQLLRSNNRWRGP